MLQTYYERMRAGGLVRTKTEFCRNWLSRSRNYLANPHHSLLGITTFYLRTLDAGLVHLSQSALKDMRRMVEERNRPEMREEEKR